MKVSLGVLLASLVALVGCTTINRSAVYNGVRIEQGVEALETIEITNAGVSCLFFIPIASGATERPNQMSCHWFSDTVTLQSNLEVLDREMYDQGATHFVNLVSHHSAESIIPFLLTYHAFHTSAVLVREKGVSERSVP